MPSGFRLVAVATKKGCSENRCAWFGLYISGLRQGWILDIATFIYAINEAAKASIQTSGRGELS